MWFVKISSFANVEWCAFGVGDGVGGIQCLHKKKSPRGPFTWFCGGTIIKKRD